MAQLIKKNVKGYSVREEDTDFTLDTVLDKLERCCQRATYGAAAGVVGGSAKGVMAGRPRTPRNSWVVNKDSQRPTGYSDEKVHPELFSRTEVIKEADELKQWLRKPD